MVKIGVYAGDLNDIVRVQAETWRVSNVFACGRDEVEVVFVNRDDSDHLFLNMHPCQILERRA